MKSVPTTGPYAFLAPYGPVDPRTRFGAPGSSFCPPWPTVALACGRLTTPYARRLHRQGQFVTYTVILLDPKTGPNTADLFWVPEHDRRRGPNVITTLTAPHRFSPQRLAALRASMPDNIARLPTPRVAVLVGGPNGDYAFSEHDISRFVTILAALATAGAGLMLTCSRRTPAHLVAGLRAATHDHACLFWSPHDSGEANPYAEFLAHADAFIVTADSVNMTGEACVTGKPVHVFQPSGGSRKFARFHASLADYGATRPLLDANQVWQSWSYAPLYSAPVIANAIRERYARRAAMLGGLMQQAKPDDDRA